MANRNKNNFLFIIQWNARSILSNKGSLEISLIQQKIDIAIVAETWLKVNVNFKIKGYTALRTDRADGKGGTLILIKNGLDFETLLVKSCDKVQLCGIKIKTQEFGELSIISAYCKPGYYLSEKEWENRLGPISGKVLLLGDFNAHSPSWGCNFLDRQGEALDKLSDTLNLIPLNDGSSTRLSPGLMNPSIVDLSFCSASLTPLVKWEVGEDSMGSDHFPIYISLEINTFYLNNNNNNLRKFKFKNAKWDVYSRIISQNLLNLRSIEIEENSYDLFIDTMLDAAVKAIPQTSPYLGKHSTVCWWSKECAEAVQKRKAAHTKFKSNPVLENFINLKKCQAIAKKCIKDAKRTTWQNFCSSLNTKASNKLIWDKVKRIKGSYTSFTKPSNEALDEFLDKLAPPEVPPQTFTPNIPDANSLDILTVPFSANELKYSLDSAPNSCPGLDNIGYPMLKFLPEEGLCFLLNLFNYIRYSHTIPQAWNNYLILPILKPGKDKKRGSSFRPIALSSCVLKIFEKMIKCRLENFLEVNYKLPIFSFGFRVGAGTLDNLTCLINNIQSAFSSKKYCPAVFVDIEGAYDNINISILFKKLITLGIGIKTSKLIIDLISHRTINVKINNQVSCTRLLFKGVPQGSVLSPILFLCYTYDIFSTISPSCRMLQYADDIVIYTSNHNLDSALIDLDMSMYALIEYLNVNGLSLSASKSNVCIFAKRRLPGLQSILLGDQQLPVVSVLKYLGLYLDSKLLWKAHIFSLYQKSSITMNLLRTIAHFSWGADPRILIRIYRATIRAQLDYGSFLYSSASNSVLQRLDRIQYQAIRICLGYLRTSPTNAILIEANEPPLLFRRQYLAYRFFIKRKAKFYHPTIEAINDLEQSYDISGYWNYSNIPILVQTAKEFHRSNLKIEKYSVLPKFKIDTATINQPPKININPAFSLNEHGNYETTIYTDGSKSIGKVGCAFYDYNRSFFALFKLPNSLSIFSAELIAIKEAIRYVISGDYTNAVIVSDSQSALRSLKIKRKANINNIQAEIIVMLNQLYRNNRELSLRWTKGHSSSTGNYIADYLAKRAGTVGVYMPIGTPWSDLIASFKSNVKIKWHNHWRYTSQTRGSALALVKPLPSRPWFESSNLTRNEIVTFNRLRINHTLCNAHLFRFNIMASPQCSCNLAPATPEHLIMACPVLTVSRNNLIIEIAPNFRSPPKYLDILKEASDPTVKAIVHFIRRNSLSI